MQNAPQSVNPKHEWEDTEAVHVLPREVTKATANCFAQNVQFATVMRTTYKHCINLPRHLINKTIHFT